MAGTMGNPEGNKEMSKGPIYKWKGGKVLVRVEPTHSTFGSIIRGRHLDPAKVKQVKEGKRDDN